METLQPPSKKSTLERISVNYGSNRPSRHGHYFTSGEDSIKTTNRLSQGRDALDERLLEQLPAQEGGLPRRCAVETYQSLEHPHQSPLTANDVGETHPFRQSVDGFRTAKASAGREAKNVAQIMLKQKQQRTTRLLNNGFTLYPSNER